MNMQPSMSLSAISSNGKQLNTLSTEILKKLRNNDTEEKILQASVAIIHQALKCDRVVVYGMQPNSFCKITAEAVTPGYAQILNRVIRDVCFEEGYIEKYQKGRIIAIGDVNNSGMAPCHLESLKAIDVKSNLVIPLIDQDFALYGLLVMHQCSQTRQWMQSEVEFILEMANWTMEQLSLLKARINLTNQLENTQQAQQLINSITQEIHAAVTFKEVLQLGVDKAKSILNCDRVVVYCLQDQSLGEIVAEAAIPALATILGSVIKDPCFEYRYIDQYEQGRIRAIPNIYEAGMTSCYIENLAKIGVRSNLIAPINWDDGKIYGLLVAHQCFSFKDWQKSEITYFKDIALHTGLSLSKARLKEQSQVVEGEINKLDNLKNIVNLAQSKIQQIKEPLQNTSQILIEVNNLNKLLDREINLINQNGSLQTKKDTKMIQIMIKKLAVITYKFKSSLVAINQGKSEADNLLDEALIGLADNKTVKLLEESVNQP